MFYIDKKSSIKIGYGKKAKYVKYGDKIDEKIISKELFSRLKKQGKIGDIIDVIKTTDSSDEKIGAATKKLKDMNTELETNLLVANSETTELKSSIETKDMEITELKSSIETKDMEITELKSSIEDGDKNK